MYNYSQVPEYMHEGIRLYVEHRIKPGSFLMAVLENNFVEAIGFADNNNLRCLPQWAELLRWELPGNCWGSPEKVQAWLDGREDND